MKTKYTRKHICEAIKYWKKQLKKLDESMHTTSSSATLSDTDNPTFYDFLEMLDYAQSIGIEELSPYGSINSSEMNGWLDGLVMTDSCLYFVVQDRDIYPDEYEDEVYNDYFGNGIVFKKITQRTGKQYLSDPSKFMQLINQYKTWLTRRGKEFTSVGIEVSPLVNAPSNGWSISIDTSSKLIDISVDAE